jgi:shikimate dehydrogenase
VDPYVVIGNPVSHSKSPLIHTLFAKQTGQDIEYTTLLAETGHFVDSARGFFAGGGKGANVTVPFKQDAYALADRLTPEAETAGAVNTLYLHGDKLCGHNTDGLGLVRDVLVNHRGSLTGKHILILGAGGATRGILQPVLAQKPASILIVNRTVSNAGILAESFKPIAQSSDISGCGFDELGGTVYDWIFNATSASLLGEMPTLPDSIVGTDTWCYDLMYSNDVTPFCRWARDTGALKVMDGLGMLVEQAAESFEVWRGIRPETAGVLARLRHA